MEYSLEIKSAKTGSYYFEEPLLKLFTSGNCAVTIFDDKILYEYHDVNGRELTLTFPIISKSKDIFETTSYLVSTKFDYNIQFSINKAINKVYKFSSYRKDGFEVVYAPRTSGYGYVSTLNSLYPNKKYNL